MKPKLVEYNEIMAEAERHDWHQSHDFFRKLKTNAYFRARKMVRRAPYTLPGTLAGKVPIIGGMLKEAASFITTKLRNGKVKKQVFAATFSDDPNEVEVRALYKELRAYAEKLDRGVVKWAHAADEVRLATQGLTAAAAATPENFPAAFWRAACAVQRLDHYNEKMANRMDDVYYYLEILSEWGVNRRKDLEAAQATVKEIFMQSDYEPTVNYSVGSPRPSTGTGSGYIPVP